ncbi:S41 family peptidase [Sulfurivermis fontis]|uniref:S41 family peptidase n=1 Tax=Sulfurivermis fontis TaxID=1972068 RepID=UPI000FDA9A21|nr:S41 family peptidase [Sulfurivermis fontis]
MKQATRSLLVLSTGLILGVSLTLGGSVLADRTNNQATPLPLDELRNFSEVFGKIKADYVEEADDKALLESAIRGMLSGLDPHSAYLDQEEFKELQVGTSGEFGGLGIEVGMEDGFVKVVSPIDDTPAQAAGVKAGDLIIRLDETPVKGMSLNDAVKMMRGKPGTQITLTIMREGEQKPLKLTITRDIIRVKSVKFQSLEPGYGYLRITSFQNQTGEQVLKAISDMKKEHGQLKGLVLDLRNNPGGVLGAAVSVSDAFLDKGMIVYTEGRAKDAELRYTATPGDALNGAPMVVLVNGGSASASEIVAGALQDHKRAIIMGARTFGKGSVQTIFPMSNNSAIKLTTARYYTPGGRSIQADGIEPDIALKAVKLVETEDGEDGRLKEADLSGHLANGNGKKTKDGKDAKKDGKAAEIVSKDYALHEALNLLKGLHILQARGQ